MNPTQARQQVKALKEKLFDQQDINNKDFGSMHEILSMLYDIECLLMEDEYAIQDKQLEKYSRKKAA